jgi:hypothetical protein
LRYRRFWLNAENIITPEINNGMICHTTSQYFIRHTEPNNLVGILYILEYAVNIFAFLLIYAYIDSTKCFLIDAVKIENYQYAISAAVILDTVLSRNPIAIYSFITLAVFIFKSERWRFLSLGLILINGSNRRPFPFSFFSGIWKNSHGTNYTIEERQPFCFLPERIA